MLIFCSKCVLCFFGTITELCTISSLQYYYHLRCVIIVDVLQQPVFTLDLNGFSPQRTRIVSQDTYRLKTTP